MASYTLSPATARGHLAAALIRLTGWLLQTVGHKGHYRICKILGRRLDRDQTCQLHFRDDCTFEFSLHDQYWSRILAPSYAYEAEIGHLFRLLDGTPFALLDCGANFGYWSVYATGRQTGCAEAIAVEALPATYQRLARNASLNGDRFRVLNRAIYDRDGLPVTIEIEGDNHSGASIGQEVGTDGSTGSSGGVEVDSLTIDSLVGQLSNPDQLVVLKLDVEGVERPAMLAADRLLQGEFLIVFEDYLHPEAAAQGEADSAMTDFFLTEQGCEVYFISDKGRVSRIDSAAAASAVKDNPHRGYNFIAVRPNSATAALLQNAL